MTKTFDQRAQTIRLLVLDVDGVLTDGSLTFTGEGELSKTFNVRDGLGIKLLQAAGIEVAILTGRTSSIVAHRADELGMTRVELTEAKLQPENIAYMGDDLPDIPCLKLAGLAATPADGSPELDAVVDWRAPVPGGRGAVRAFAERILRAQGKWDPIIAAALAEE